MVGRHHRPDPSAMRLAFGVAGLAAASAVTTAVVAPSLAPARVTVTQIVVPAESAPVRHVVRYVHLKPGQTAPPRAIVAAALPAPTPRVVVITTTQSGAPRP